MSEPSRHIDGWLRLKGGRPPGRSIRIRVGDAGTGATLAEGASLPDGRFAVAVRVDPHHSFKLVLEAVDRTGEVLGRQAVSDDRPILMTLRRTPSDKDVPPPLLRAGAAAELAGGIAWLEASGHLPVGAVRIAAAALDRLAWLDSLLAPARRAILGDAEAAAVIREALSSWAGEVCCASVAVDAGDRVRDEASEIADALVSANAVGTLLSAVLTAGRNAEEQLDMADGLVAILSVRPWIEALAMAARAGDTGGVRAMMGVPGPMPAGLPVLGGLPPGGLPGGGIPGPPGGFPGLPGGTLGGKPRSIEHIGAHPTISDIVARFRTPAMQTPTSKERCLVGAAVEVARLRDSTPPYRITGLSPADACPGSELAITGRNFGNVGSVVFPGAAPIASINTLEWTDQRIRVIVPVDAGPGPISLSILLAALLRCDEVFTVFRSGGSDVSFEGGTATVKAFLLDGNPAGPLRVEPGEVVSISCDVTAHSNARTRVFVTRDGATIADFGNVNGGGHRQHDFTAPAATTPVTCIVHLLVGGPCGEVDHLRTITVSAAPHLRIAFIEVTQALQNSAHTVRLVDGRTTGVRAYLTSGLGAFSYTGKPGEIANVTGSLRVERGGAVVATIAASAPVTVGNTFVDADRSKLANALTFLVPGALMAGDVTMRVNARVVGVAGFENDDLATSGTRTVHAERQRTAVLMRLRMVLSNPAHPLPTPTVADWQGSAVGTQDRYPVGDGGIVVRVPATGDVLSTDHFLDKTDGWEDALDDLDDYADRFDDFNTIFACVVLPKGSFPLNGISHAAVDRPWPLSNDRRCLLAQAGLRATFAHEMAHTLGVGHAPCADPGRDFPDGIDPNLPAATEPGVVGWRMSDGLLMPPNWSELMSYCTPSGFKYDDRWPSVALWNILLDQLN